MNTSIYFHEDAACQIHTLENPFQSFWMGGFECTDKLNVFGKRVDFLSTTGHLQMLAEDYENVNLFKIRTVREGIRWSQVENRPYEYDWSTVAFMMECARKNKFSRYGTCVISVSLMTLRRCTRYLQNKPVRNNANVLEFATGIKMKEPIAITNKPSAIPFL